MFCCNNSVADLGGRGTFPYWPHFSWFYAVFGTIVNKTETFDTNIIIFIIFYIFLNKTMDICEFESWLKLRSWLNQNTHSLFGISFQSYEEFLQSELCVS